MRPHRVIIIGAGPTGLMLANLLGDAHVPCLLVERRTGLPAQSRAIGVSPPSLDLFASLDLAEPLIERGVPVRDAVVSNGRSEIGSLSFRDLPEPYRFILSVPQRDTMEILQERLQTLPDIEYLRGTEFVDWAAHGDGVEVLLRDLGQQQEYRVEGARLVGCDGSHSSVRESCRLESRYKRYGVSFFMADFKHGPDLGHRAVLFFTADGAVESFPLPDRTRRWIAQTDAGPDEVTRADLVEQIRRRTGSDLDAAEGSEVSWWQPERRLVRQWHSGPVLLCGDAAHVMSPIGGQGMNTGLADAEFAADVVRRYLAGEDWEALCEGYERRRRRAYTAAANRAALGMWLGTRRGRTGIARDLLLKYILLGRFGAERLPHHFAMLTIPHGRLAGERA